MERMTALRHRAFTSAINLPSHRRHYEREENAEVFDDDHEGEGGAHGDGRRKKKGRRKVDLIQRRARIQVQKAQAKTDRMRQATIGEGDISDSELLRREVETDVADAIAKKQPTRKKTKSVTIESELASESTTANQESSSAAVGVRRRSQRLKSKDPIVVEGILLPRPDEATGVTKEALKMLEKKRDTDHALEKLKSLKK